MPYKKFLNRNVGRFGSKHPPSAVVLLLLGTLSLLAACSVLGQDSGTGELQSSLQAPQANMGNFPRVEGPTPFDLSTGQGAHPDYQTEWWYYTGNLDTPDGQHFGFQLTFFRRALLPPQDRVPGRTSSWAFDQVYLAHFALTDVARGQFYHAEQFGRGAAGLAGAESNPYKVWLSSWAVEQTGALTYRLVAAHGPVTLELDLVDTKGPILQGDQGYSQKGPEPGNASFYFSQTRLEASGSVRVSGEQFSVNGVSWMDHEYSTSALSSGQVGWDWFSIQLDNNTELMLFYLRREDGTIDPYSSGTIIYPDGSTHHLAREDFTITALDTWRSPHSGAVYPAAWQVAVLSLDLSLEITPYLADQELNNYYSYWEGAVQIEGFFDGQQVSGSGYVELTGYAGSMAGEF